MLENKYFILLDRTQIPFKSTKSIRFLTILATTMIFLLALSACDELVTVSGGVWLDENANGIREASEPDLADVTVNLYYAGGQLLDPFKSTQTNALGSYSFEIRNSQQIIIEFVPPEGRQFTLQDQGVSDQLDSDVDPGTGQTITINVLSENEKFWDAGFLLGLSDFIVDPVEQTATQTAPPLAQPDEDNEPEEVDEPENTVKEGVATAPDGSIITWTIRQDGDSFYVAYSVIDSIDGSPVSGAAFASIAKGDPGLDTLGGHDEQVFVNGLAELNPPIFHPAGTEVGVWVFFPALQTAIKLADCIVTP